MALGCTPDRAIVGLRATRAPLPLPARRAKIGGLRAAVDADADLHGLWTIKIDAVEPMLMCWASKETLVITDDSAVISMAINRRPDTP